MLRVGLTGGIACGKSTVAAYLRAMGAAVIDADQISRELTAPKGEALPALWQAFGGEIFHRDGTLDRSKLAQRVFSDEKERLRLEQALHPLIEQRMRKEINKLSANGVAVAVLDIPLLYETGMEGLVDCVLCVSAPREVQMARLWARDGLDRHQAEARIASQWPTERKTALADYVLNTARPEAEVRAETARLYDLMVERSKQ